MDIDATRHAGSTAIVSGAGAGIGRATALRLAREGASVTAFDVNASGLDELGSTLEAERLTATLLTADITDRADVDRVVAAAGERVDILANVAGIMDHFVPLDEVDDDLWNRVLAVNLTGVMRLTRAVLPGMRAAGRGAVVTVASKASLSGGASGVAYAASKHGVAGLVKHVAYFYGPEGIRSNGVLPGPVATSIGASSAPRSEWAMQRAQLSMATMPPPAEPDEIATTVSWLASPEASFVNGALLLADGGWSTA